MADGYQVRPEALTELSGRLTAIAGDVQALSKALGGVTASTGRPDSDEMGRLGPADAADLADLLRGALTGDSGKLVTAVGMYTGRETNIANGFRS